MELYNRNYHNHGTAYKDLEATLQEEGRHRADFDVEVELHGDRRHWPFKSDSVQSLPANHTGYVDPTKTWAENEANHLLGAYDAKYADEMAASKGPRGAAHGLDLGNAGLRAKANPGPTECPRPHTAGEAVPPHQKTYANAFSDCPEARAWREGTPGLAATRPRTIPKAGAARESPRSRGSGGGGGVGQGLPRGGGLVAFNPDGIARRPRTADAVVYCAADSYELRDDDIRGRLAPDYAYPFKSVNDRFEDQIAKRQLGQETACCDEEAPLGPGQYEYLTPRQWVHQQPQVCPAAPAPAAAAEAAAAAQP